MTSSTKLRSDIKHSGLSLAEVARRAGVSLTTLHSFVSKDSAEMRASTFEKVKAALAELNTTAPEKQTRGVREDSATFDANKHVRVEVAVTQDLLKTLRDRGVDAAAVARTGAEKALKEAEAKAWAEANRNAIDAYNVWIDKHGTLAEQFGTI